MNRPETVLFPLLAMAGCDFEPAQPVLAPKADLNVYVSGNFTDPSPTIHHEDPLVDLRNSLLAWLENGGDKRSEETEIAFRVDGVDTSTHSVPPLEPGEYFVAFNDQFIPSTANAYEFEVEIDPERSTDEWPRNNNLEMATIVPRGGVGCIVRAHTLEYIFEDQEIVPFDPNCEMRTFFGNYEHAGPFSDDVPEYNPYCHAVKDAYARGWVNGESDNADRDGDGDTREAVFRPYDCANRAEGAQMLYNAYGLTPPTEHPCLDVPLDEWYYEPMNAVAVRTGIFLDADGNCQPPADLLRYDLEAALPNL